ncbi:MAG: response regulator [Flavobacteriales bacterium]|nr:response regulator [Flavobacteriales bacterium]
MSNSKKVLVVEDEMIIADDLCNMISAKGYDCVGIARSYEEALMSISNKNPDLILLDIMLNSEKSGIDLAKKINETSQIPFIFLTSHSDSKTLEEAIETHPAGYLVKPIDEDDLNTTMALAIKSGEAQPVSTKAQKDPEFIFLKDGQFHFKLNLSDVFWVKSIGNYVQIKTSDPKSKIIRMPLKTIMEVLPSASFMRVHKSYIINLNHLDAIGTSVVKISNGAEIPLGKTYSSELSEHFNLG